MSKTVELKVARRVRGFEGRAKAAEENAARLHKTVEELRADVAKLAAVTAALATKAEQFEAAAHGRMDSIMARVCALEPAPTVEPVMASLTTAEVVESAATEPEYVCPPNHEDE